MAPVPAWKRIGLKLKQDPVQSPVEISQPPSEEVRTTAQKRPLHEPASAPPSTSSKRPRLHDKEKKSSNGAAREGAECSTQHRRKSVSFSNDTKVEDGDSVKQLKQAWLQSEQNRDGLGTGPPLSGQSHEDFQGKKSAESTEPQKKGKKVKVKGQGKKKSKTAAAITTTTTSTPPEERPFLRYLNEYSDSRATWKFNKAHQNHLIKHALKAGVIPASYLPPLWRYVGGLEGGVRQRLRDTALQIKVHDQEEAVDGFPEDMEDRASRQAEYETALRTFLKTSNATEGFDEAKFLEAYHISIHDRLARRTRAETVLKVLRSTSGPGKGHDGSAADPAQANGTTAKSNRRKRKQRTLGSDTDSSSSDSSSDPSSTTSDSE